jgi:hypothetical protein
MACFFNVGLRGEEIRGVQFVRVVGKWRKRSFLLSMKGT